MKSVYSSLVVIIISLCFVEMAASDTNSEQQTIEYGVDVVRIWKYYIVFFVAHNVRSLGSSKKVTWFILWFCAHQSTVLSDAPQRAQSRLSTIGRSTNLSWQLYKGLQRILCRKTWTQVFFQRERPNSYEFTTTKIHGQLHGNRVYQNSSPWWSHGTLERVLASQSA